MPEEIKIIKQSENNFCVYVEGSHKEGEGRTSIQKEQERGNREYERPQWKATGNASASTSGVCDLVS